MTDAPTYPATLRDLDFNVVETIQIQKRDGEFPRYLRRHIKEGGRTLVDVYQYQSASRSDAPNYWWMWTEGVDSHDRVRANPVVIEHVDFDSGNYDGGFGEGSYFQRAMEKDD